MRKATVGFIMSVCVPACLSIRLSVRIGQLGSHRTDFYEIWYLSIFRKSVEKIQVFVKSDKNNGYFAWRHSTYILPRWILLRMRSIFSPWKSCRSWDNVEKKSGRTRQVKEGNIIRRMRLACWITKATNTHTLTLLSHGNSGYANAPPCYVICTLHALFVWKILYSLHVFFGGGGARIYISYAWEGFYVVRVGSFST